MKQLLLLLLFPFISFSQSATITPGTKGTVQLPVLSYSQINSIPSPKAGMMVFDSTFKCLKYYNGIKWLCSSQNDENRYAVGFAWKHNHSSYQGSDIVSKLHIDNNNNVYISGMLAGGYMYPFVAKYSPTGNLLWNYEPFSLNYSNAPALFTDVDSNTYAIFTISWRGYSGVGIHKILPNGNAAWVVGLSDYQSSANAANLFIDNNQNIYVTGTFSGTITTDAGTISSTNGDAFIAKYSKDGIVQWIKNAPSPVIGINSNGESYFTKTFTNSLLIQGNYYNSYGGTDILFGKLNMNGQLNWIKHIGSAGNEKITSASIDASGNFYATGSFSSSVSFDGNIANAVDAEDFFVAKYNTDGVFNWVRNGGGIGKDEGVKLQLTNDDNIVVSGIASSNSVSFYPNITINPSTSPSNFLLKYDSNGNIAWAKPNEPSTNFKVNKSGNIYMWANIGNGNIYTPAGINILTKYLSNGEFVYRQINGGTIYDLEFGNDNHFFFTGNFNNTIQIGASTLTCTDGYGDIFISHWIE